MKKRGALLVLFLCLLLVLLVSAATFIINISFPQTGGYYANQVDSINATTNGSTNCTYVIFETDTPANQVTGYLDGNNSGTHGIMDINISTLADGNLTINITCLNYSNASDNDTAQVINFTKDTSPPIITWNQPVGGGTPPGNTIILLNTSVETDVPLDCGEDSMYNFSVSCNGSLGNGVLNAPSLNCSDGGWMYNITQNWTSPNEPCSCNITLEVENVGEIYNNDTILVNVQAPFPSVNVTKTPLEDTYYQFENFTYEINVTNNGSTNLIDVMLYDEYNATEINFTGASCPVNDSGIALGYGFVDINITACFGVLTPGQIVTVYLNFTDGMMAPLPLNATNNVTIDANNSYGGFATHFDEVNITIISDNIPPEITFINPSSPGYFEYSIDPVSVLFNATDDMWVENWTVNNNNFDFEHIGDSIGNLTNNTALSVGNYSLLIRVNDSMNNTNSTVYKVVIQDTTAPSFTITPPNATLEYYYNTTNILFNASDAQWVASWYVNDTNFTFNTNIDRSAYLQNTTILPVGIYVLNLTVSDPSGNNASYIYQVNVTDTIAPTITNPVNLTNVTLEFGYDNTNITFNATDMSDLDMWTVDNTNFDIHKNSNLDSAYLTNNTNLPVGNYVLKIRINDTYDNANWTIFSVNITDTIAPVITAPANVTLEFGYDSLNETFNYTDMSALDDWGVDDSLNFETDSAMGNSTYLLNDTYLSVGNYTLNMSVTDVYGNLAWVIYGVEVRDTTAPVITAPANVILEFGYNYTNITFNATDMSALDIWTVDDSNFEIHKNPNLNSSFLINNTYLSVGNYTLNITVNDTYGNRGEVIYNVEITDTIAPNITAQANLTNITVEYNYDLVNVTFNATDMSALDRWSVNDGNFNISTNADNSSFLINNTNLSVGNYILKIMINDTYGNSNWTVYSVNVTDTIAPNITAPADASLSYASRGSLNVDFNATDMSPLDTWRVNHASFTIDENGTLTSVGSLSESTIYIFLVFVNDTYNNTANVTYTVTVGARHSSSGGRGISTPPIPTMEDLLNGISFSFGQGDWAAFYAEDGSLHQVKLLEILVNQVRIQVASTPQVVILGVGESEKFDVTGDGIYDIEVKVNSIQNNKAEVTIMAADGRKITEEVEEGDTIVLDGEREPEPVEEKEDREFLDQDTKFSLYRVIIILVIVLVFIMLVKLVLSIRKKRRQDRTHHVAKSIVQHKTSKHKNIKKSKHHQKSFSPKTRKWYKR